MQSTHLYPLTILLIPFKNPTLEGSYLPREDPEQCMTLGTFPQASEICCQQKFWIGDNVGIPAHMIFHEMALHIPCES